MCDLCLMEKKSLAHRDFTLMKSSLFFQCLSAEGINVLLFVLFWSSWRMKLILGLLFLIVFWGIKLFFILLWRVKPIG